MLLYADPTTAIIDPVLSPATISLICDVKDPMDGKDYDHDPRYVARKAEAYLKTTGIADVSYWGPELEFFIFNSIAFDTNSHESFYSIDSQEGIWNSGDTSEPNLGYRPRHKEGYFPCPPTDQMHDIRTEMTLKMVAAGIDIEKHHHEVATGGQVEFGMRFNTLLKQADSVMMYKYIAKPLFRPNQDLLSANILCILQSWYFFVSIGFCIRSFPAPLKPPKPLYKVALVQLK